MWAVHFARPLAREVDGSERWVPQKAHNRRSNGLCKGLILFYARLKKGCFFKGRSIGFVNQRQNP